LHNKTDKFIPALVQKNMQTMLPSFEEIQHSVFAMKTDGAPGPDENVNAYLQVKFQLKGDSIMAHTPIKWFSSEMLIANSKNFSISANLPSNSKAYNSVALLATQLQEK
jgi:hypothetical protein